MNQTKMKVSVCHYICPTVFINNCPSSQPHNWQVNYRGPKGSTVCQVWSCLDKQFSKKLQAIIPKVKSSHSKQARFKQTKKNHYIIFSNVISLHCTNLSYVWHWKKAPVLMAELVRSMYFKSSGTIKSIVSMMHTCRHTNQRRSDCTNKNVFILCSCFMYIW